jgi:CRISPR-associated protein Cas2
MVVICLADVAERFHGFLRSAMLNPHPGVYLAMDLDAGSRTRIWAILERWWQAEPSGMGVILWRDPQAPMGVTMASFGAPKRRIVEFEGQWALARAATGAEPPPDSDPPF